MMLLKPSMIKVGFLLVAGSQDQVLGMTQKADSLQAEGVVPSSLPESRSGIWQPQLALSERASEAAESSRALCRRLRTNLPRRSEAKRGRDEHLHRGFTARRDSEGAAAAPKRGRPWPQVETSSGELRNLRDDLKSGKTAGLVSNKTRIHYLPPHTLFMTFFQIPSKNNKKHLNLFLKYFNNFFKSQFLLILLSL